jgi:hypothetical protein
MNLARAEKRAKDLGLKVTWVDEELPWDGDCEAPAIYVQGTVLHPDHADAADADTRATSIRFPFWDRKDGTRGRDRAVLASLGGVGFDSWSDPYVRVVEAELLSEALAELDEERDAEATLGAAELSARATYATGEATGVPA